MFHTLANNGNQNNIEIPSHPNQNGYHQENSQQ
jgi:hypothetical protein